MPWQVILTSGITAAIIGAIIGGVVSYVVSKRLQTEDRKYQEQKEQKEKDEETLAWLESIRLNKTQKELLEFCRGNVSERYNLQSSAGMSCLVSVDTEKRLQLSDGTIRNQVDDMICKGYFNELSDMDHWFIFELTTLGTEVGIE